jgi:hypothetical protein
VMSGGSSIKLTIQRNKIIVDQGFFIEEVQSSSFFNSCLDEGVVLNLFIIFKEGEKVVKNDSEVIHPAL